MARRIANSGVSNASSLVTASVKGWKGLLKMTRFSVGERETSGCRVSG